MVQTQMCINDNFDDSNRTPVMENKVLDSRYWIVVFYLHD